MLGSASTNTVLLKRLAVCGVVYGVLSLTCFALSQLEAMELDPRTLSLLQPVVTYTFFLFGPAASLIPGSAALKLYVVETVIVFGLLILCLQLESRRQSLEIRVAAWMLFGIVWLGFGFLWLIFFVT